MHCFLCIENQPVGLQTLYKQVYHVLGTNQNLHNVFHKIFYDNFNQSSYPIPIFVPELLKLEKWDELLNFLITETPYLNCFSIVLMEEVVKVVDNEKAEEMLTQYKKMLFTTQKEDILLLMTQCQAQKENFISVVFKMTKHFDFYTYEGLHAILKLFSVLLKLPIVSFGGYDRKRKTITCYIPTICAKRAIFIAENCLHQYTYVGILSLTIDRHPIVKQVSNDQIVQHDISGTSSEYVHKYVH